MRSSLKSSILYLIKSQGEVSLKDIEKFCHENGYKVSNAERRLRPLENGGIDSPIEEIRNPSGKAIIGYRLKATQGDYSVPKPKVDIQCQLFNLPLKSPYDY